MRRPIKSEPRDRQLNLSLTARELESLRQRARAAGMRPAPFGRALLLHEDRQFIPGDEAEANRARLVHGQLVRLGNNLNQLLRHLHRTDEPIPADLEPLLKTIRQLIAGGPR